MNLKNLYNNVSMLFTVVTIILVAYILKFLFTVGFIYFYFGKSVDFSNYSGF